MDEAADDLGALEAHLAGFPSAVVAFSGGVDSGVVAASARRALGERALAVTIYGPAVSLQEVDQASRVARAIGIRHRLVRLDPTRDPSYAANPTNRCYFCRGLEAGVLVRLARDEGFAVVLDGIQPDDLTEDRPGIRAMNEAGVLHPLVDMGLGKDRVRRLARRLRLPNHDAPSNSCLASRIAHGDRVTPGLLARVEAAETLVARRGFRRVRVRVAGERARIQVGADEVARLRDPALNEELTRALRSLGFASVEVDPLGYRPAGAPPVASPAPAPRRSLPSSSSPSPHRTAATEEAAR